MHNVSRQVLVLGVVLGVCTAAVPGRADDPAEYCRSYANAAINASRAARTHDRCLRFIEERPARWGLDYGNHFRFCMGAFGSGANQREWDARSAELDRCVSGR
jgi:hypothetical protein